MSPCVHTTYALNSSGYGGCRYLGVKVGAHVAAYCRAHGMHPNDLKGKVVQHICDCRSCVNLSHLVLGTQSTNIRDALDKGRLPQATRTRADGKGKISHEVIVEAAQRYVCIQGHSSNIKELAGEYGVHPQYLRRLIYAYKNQRG